MLSLLGSLLGFGTSFLPSVMDYFKEGRDQEHELRLMDKQLESQKVIGAQKLQMVNVDADIRETESLQKSSTKITLKATQGFINLSASVRPLITYCLFLEFAFLTIAVNVGWIDIKQYSAIWNEPTMTLWAAVVSFWFGSRSFNRK